MLRRLSRQRIRRLPRGGLRARPARRAACPRTSTSPRAPARARSSASSATAASSAAASGSSTSASDRASSRSRRSARRRRRKGDDPLVRRATTSSARGSRTRSGATSRSTGSSMTSRTAQGHRPRRRPEMISRRDGSGRSAMAELRVREDPVRILRAARFAGPARFRRWTPDLYEAAARNHAADLDQVRRRRACSRRSTACWAARARPERSGCWTRSARSTVLLPEIAPLPPFFFTALERLERLGGNGPRPAVHPAVAHAGRAARAARRERPCSTKAGLRTTTRPT